MSIHIKWGPGVFVYMNLGTFGKAIKAIILGFYGIRKYGIMGLTAWILCWTHISHGYFYYILLYYYSLPVFGRHSSYSTEQSTIGVSY